MVVGRPSFATKLSGAGGSVRRMADRAVGTTTGSAVQDRTPSDAAASVALGSRDAAEAYVASVCFKHGPPRRIGVELEWLVHPASAPAAPVDVAALRAALGPHAPRSLDPRLAGPPASRRVDGHRRARRPGRAVHRAAAPAGPPARHRRRRPRDAHPPARRAGLALGPARHRPAPPARAACSTCRATAPWSAGFDRRGPAGRTMMCSTAGLQVCLDAGEGAEVADRWAALHALGPPLLAAFATSPLRRAAHRLGVGAHGRCGSALDPRAHRAPSPAGRPGRRLGALRAGDAALLCVAAGRPVGRAAGRDLRRLGRRGAAPTAHHWPTSTTTSAPCSRRCARAGYLEVRYLDAQPGAAVDRSRSRCWPRCSPTRRAPPRRAGVRVPGGALGRGGPARPGRPRPAPGGRRGARPGRRRAARAGAAPVAGLRPRGRARAAGAAGVVSRRPGRRRPGTAPPTIATPAGLNRDVDAEEASA